jgi:hypothetical protein
MKNRQIKAGFRLLSNTVFLTIIFLIFWQSGNMIFADSTETAINDSSNNLNNVIEINPNNAKSVDESFNELLEIHEQKQTMMICSLTLVTPYYNCSEQWEINIYPNKYSGMIPCPVSNTDNLYGCTNYLHKKIDMLKIGLDRKDDCNRTILMHELLHMKYKDQTPHYSCIFW